MNRSPFRRLSVSSIALLAISCGTIGPLEDLDDPGFGEEKVRVMLKKSTIDSFVFTIQFPHASAEARSQAGRAWVRLVVPDCAEDSCPPGHPDVPHWGGLFAVPLGARARLVSATPTVGARLLGRLFPSQPFGQEASTDVDRFQDETPPPPEVYRGAPFAFDPSAYDDPVPAEVARIVTIGESRGMALAAIACACGKYDPRADATALYSSVDVEIAFEGGERSFLPIEAFNGFERYPGLPSGGVMNGDAVWRYPPGGVLSRFCPGEELLILTAPRFRPQADAIALRRNQQGIATSVVEVNDGMGGGPDTAEEIDAFLDDRFESCYVRFSYVLILGDADDVPTFVIQRLDKDEGVTIATDYPYATYATPPEQVDLAPDFHVGRIAVDTEAQMDVVVQKLADHDDNPPLAPSFYGTVSFPAFFECCNTGMVPEGQEAGRNFVSVSEGFRTEFQSLGHGHERIYTTNADYAPEYAGDPTPQRFSNGTLLPAALQSPFPWDGDAQDIADAMNDGRFLVVHLDHGWPGGFGDPLFTKSDVTNLLTNATALPVLLSENCSTGSYDTTECFAERMLHHEDGGAVGVYAWTRMCNTLYFRAVVRGAIGAFWGDQRPQWGDGTKRLRLGDALTSARLRIAAEHAGADPTSAAYRNAVNHVRIYHLFGDPTAEIRTRSPIQLPRPFEIEVLPDFLQIFYAFEGAQITALQDLGRGMVVPLGRGLVSKGMATLPFVNAPAAGVPILLFAASPDAFPVRLQ